MIALSSAEAELYALVRRATAAVGLQSLAEDLGSQLGVRIMIDASATLSIVRRQGLGKLRHVNTRYLWIQQKVAEGEVKVMKIDGVNNLANGLTKHVSAAMMRQFCDGIALREPDEKG